MEEMDAEQSSNGKNGCLTEFQWKKWMLNRVPMDEMDAEQSTNERNEC